MYSRPILQAIKDYVLPRKYSAVSLIGFQAPFYLYRGYILWLCLSAWCSVSEIHKHNRTARKRCFLPQFTGFLVLLVIVDVVHGSSEPTSYRGCIDMCSDRYDICRSTCVGKKLVKELCETSFRTCLRACFKMLARLL